MDLEKNMMIMLLAVVALVGCKPKDIAAPPATEEVKVETDVEIEPKLLGAWKNTSMSIHFNHQDAESSQTTITEENLGEKLNLQKIEFTMFDDGRFLSKYVKLDGELHKSEDTNWWREGDSVYLVLTPFVELDTVAYGYTTTEDTYQLRSLYDWDNDGEKDDIMTMDFKREETK